MHWVIYLSYFLVIWQVNKEGQHAQFVSYTSGDWRENNASHSFKAYGIWEECYFLLISKPKETLKNKHTLNKP